MFLIIMYMYIYVVLQGYFVLVFWSPHTTHTHHKRRDLLPSRNPIHSIRQSRKCQTEYQTLENQSAEIEIAVR